MRTTSEAKAFMEVRAITTAQLAQTWEHVLDQLKPMGHTSLELKHGRGMTKTSFEHPSELHSWTPPDDGTRIKWWSATNASETRVTLSEGARHPVSDGARGLAHGIVVSVTTSDGTEPQAMANAIARWAQAHIAQRGRTTRTVKRAALWIAPALCAGGAALGGASGIQSAAWAIDGVLMVIAAGCIQNGIPWFAKRLIEVRIVSAKAADEPQHTLSVTEPTEG